MITEDMLREAAEESLKDYVNSLERDYDPEHPHKFSLQFEKKIKKLKRKAEHPVLYRTLQRAASFLKFFHFSSFYPGNPVDKPGKTDIISL